MGRCSLVVLCVNSLKKKLLLFLNFLLECLVGDLEYLVGMLDSSLLPFQMPNSFGTFLQ